MGWLFLKVKVKSTRGGWGTGDYRRRSFGRPAGISRSPSRLCTQGVACPGRAASGLPWCGCRVTFRSAIAVAFGVGAAADHAGQQSLPGLPRPNPSRRIFRPTGDMCRGGVLVAEVFARISITQPDDITFSAPSVFALRPKSRFVCRKWRPAGVTEAGRGQGSQVGGWRAGTVFVVQRAGCSSA